jgi:SAM-dependent methyltransferase
MPRANPGVLRLNLGCGRRPLDGWTNVDKFPGDAVEWNTVVDLERVPWPWATSSVDEVRADRLLNHLRNWEDAVLECARVLRPGGRATIVVHAGLLPLLTTPYEMRAFGPRSLDMFLDNARVRTGVPWVTVPFQASTLEWDGSAWFTRLSYRRLHETYPFAWHLARLVGPHAYELPLGRTTNLEFVLRRNERRWHG